jgi:hypothetical protein
VTAVLALGLLALCACSSTLPHQLPAGGTFVSAFDPGSAAAMGFASTYGGEDPQRGAVQFVLCPPEARLCELSTPAGRGTGFALETQFVTRMGPDPFSPMGLAGRIDLPKLGTSIPLPGAAVALLRVPRRDQGGPAPGRYRVEARLLGAQGPEDLLRGLGASVEILDGVGEPVALRVPLSLAQLVPLPRITLTATPTAAGSRAASPDAPAAAEIVIRYPSAKVTIRGAAEVGGLGPASMVSLAPGPTADTVRISLLAPQRETHQIGVAFAAIGRDPAPVRAEEFEIVEQRLYDERGALDGSIRFRIEPLIR